MHEDCIWQCCYLNEMMCAAVDVVRVSSWAERSMFGG